MVSLQLLETVAPRGKWYCLDCGTLPQCLKGKEKGKKK